MGYGLGGVGIQEVQGRGVGCSLTALLANISEIMLNLLFELIDLVPRF